MTARLAPGLALAAVIALAAQYVAEHYGAPAMLMAVLIGAAFNHLSASPKLGPGLSFAARDLLRIGVALLGVRLTIGDMASLGAAPFILIVSGVAFTVIVGAAIGRLCGLTPAHAVLSAGAVGICGASAALAIAAALPASKDGERNAALTVASVTALSTLAMLIYPLISSAMNFDDRSAGVFIGATIHDVAQVVGAGYTISETAGETATLVKLVRVGCLLPVVIAVGWLFRGERRNSGDASPTALAPTFMVAFFVLMAINSAGLISPTVKTAMTMTSQWALITAVAALGVRTSMAELTAVGPSPLVALCLQTAALAGFILIGLSLAPL